MLTIKAVQEQKAENQVKLKAIWEDVEKREVKNLTDDETKIVDELQALIEGANDTIEKLKTSEEAVEPDAPESNPDTTSNTAKDEAKKEIVAKERKQFENYIRAIKNAEDGNLSASENGAVIPTTIADKIIEKVYDISPILEKSTQYNVPGKLEIPCYGKDDANNIQMAYKDEFNELISTSGNFTSIELEGFLAGALTKISRKLINNSKFDIVSFVVRKMAEAIARFIEHELLIGTDGKIEGLAKGITQVVTSDSATALVADDLIRTQDSVKQAFQSKAIWIMSSKTLTAIRLLKYTVDGHYILNQDLTSEFGYKLLGKDVYVSDNMPEIEAGKKVVYYGNMQGLASKFTNNMEIQVLNELFATQHATGVVGWIDFDAKVEDAQALAALEMGA